MGAPVLYHVGRAYGSYLYSRAAARSTNFLRSLWEEEGWGALTVKTEPLVVEVRGNFEARGTRQDGPACFFTKGFLEGFLSQASGRGVKLTERECIAKGDKECVFQEE